MKKEERNIYGKQAALVGIVGNTFLTIFNILVGVFSGSYALIAEGAHTLSDVATSIIAFIGFKLASKPADHDHPLGHGRAEAISGLVIVVFLAVVAYEIISGAIKNLLITQTPSVPSYLAGVMAVIGIIANIAMSQKIISIGKSINSPAIIADGKHQRVDLLSSLAIVIGVIISHLGFTRIDSIIGLCIGCLVLKTAYEVGKDNINNIMGKVPSNELIKEIEEIGDSVNGAIEIHDIRVNFFGSYATVTCHVSVDPKLSIIEAHKITHEVQNKIENKIDIVHGVTAHACPYGIKYDHNQQLDE
ncbi:cation transporter [Methanobrevibacter sp. 87.7]|uniref:cation diffusion facilitator family transporter n=1 Tax=Methanobrevibacter sp. 87.7 TaxID=387957 RepID=UPI000B50D245|nr:cation diffusion facilitator family transporter [Methanobrevibacter sp. 87.7]OWT32766.1 cation transporter [Methanobrevibacter sp. 87.7]